MTIYWIYCNNIYYINPMSHHVTERSRKNCGILWHNGRPRPQLLSELIRFVLPLGLFLFCSLGAIQRSSALDLETGGNLRKYGSKWTVHGQYIWADRKYPEVADIWGNVAIDMLKFEAWWFRCSTWNGTTVQGCLKNDSKRVLSNYGDKWWLT